MKEVNLRNLRRMVSGDRRKIMDRLRSDLSYMIKPRPRYVPKVIWVRLLSLFIVTDLKEIIK